MRTFFALTSALLACTMACGGSPSSSGPVGVSAVPTSADRRPVRFEYDSLDERPVNSASMKGRLGLIAFITTWDIASQAQVDYLVAMAKNDGEKVAYALVALQERRDREFIELYRNKLGVTFPVALADRETIAGGGPFGDVHVVPTVVLVDREGRVLWRHVGLAKSEEIRREMRGH